MFVDAGGDGRFGSPPGEGMSGLRTLGGASTGDFEAVSKYFQNFPSLTCQFLHSASEAYNVYLMLLKNSTSMMWISCTEMPDTSAHVLLVYVLSSRTAHVSPQLCYPDFSLSLTLVAQHQRHGEEPEFTTEFPLDARIQFLEPIDEHESQKNDVL